ncbi:MAG: hypothetical protein K2X86_13230, partial [Cytophagaceae bacterium]|nr:hypothetical protein [Cytophagaceae bacterium]
MLKSLPLILLFVLVALTGSAQKIVGYLPSYRDPSPTNIQYSKLNTIIYAFINPNTTGNLITTNVGNAAFDFDMTHFLTVKNNCSNYGVKLSVSLGGADAGNLRSNRLNAVSGNATYRATLVSELVNFAITHNLSGIDVDWEFPTTAAARTNHEALLSALRTAINASANPAIRIGVAVGGEYTGSPNHMQYFNTPAITYVDDFHIMAYDFPSSYSTNHSSLTDAQSSITQWNTVKGVPMSKMYLGVPFYGRNTARTLESDYRNFSAGAASYNVDTYSGWYYNGKTTLETKTDWIISQGGQGIMIWDLGQDRTDAYSLLSVIYTRMSTLCPAPQPSLGPDVGFCSGSVNLNSNVAAQAGRTFTWKRNGSDVVTNSATANTYTATLGGTYIVEVTQSGCTKTDQIIVTAGSSLGTTGDTRCGPGTVNLSVTTAGGPFDWYDALTGGTKVYTGANYSPGISATTTYYVQENTGSSTYNAGKAVISVPAAWNEAGYEATNSLPRHAQKIVVSQDLTIQPVKIWTSNQAITGVKVMVISGVNGTSVVSQTTPVNLAANGSPYTLTVNLTLTAGTYYVGAYAPVPGGGGTGIWLESNTNYPTSQAGVYSIEGKSYANYGSGFNAAQTPTHYGQLFDWVITTGIVPPCGRTPVVATVNAAANTGLTVSAASPVCVGVDGSVTVQSSETGVSYQPYIGASTVGTAVSGTGSNITLTVNAGNLSVGSNTITVKATKTGCGTVDLATQPTITVNDVPAQPSTIAGSTPVCLGSQNYSVTNVAGVTYTWSVSGGGTITGTGNAISVNWASAGTHTLTCTPSNTCGNGTARTRNITVNDVPAQPSTIAGSTPVCLGSQNY